VTEPRAIADRSELARIAGELGLPLTPVELDALCGAADDLLEDYELLHSLPEPDLVTRARVREVVDRGGRPAAEDNPYHGWAWRCRIEGSPDGPLAGRTVGIKDSVAVGGLPLRNGSDFFEGFVPREDATVVARLLDAGATVVGKTAVPSFCFEGAGLYGEPAPLTANPASPDHLPGGSSSGSAALVASGNVDLAIGGDQGGSIRIPASWCGCVGLKPTFGLVPYTGALAMDMTFDHLGPIAASVADCAVMTEVLAGPDGLDPRQPGRDASGCVAALERGSEGLRVGILREGFGFEGVSEPDVDERVRAVAEALADEGAQVTEVSVDGHREGAAIWDAICLQGATDLMRGHGIAFSARGAHGIEASEFVARVWQERSGVLPPTLKLTLALGQLVTERYGRVEYARAQNLALWLERQYDAAFAGVDVLVMPTTPMKAPRRPGPDMSEAERIVLAVGIGSSRNAAPFDVSGHPSLSVPCGTSDGLPVGFMVAGRKFDEGAVLRAGQAVERVVERRF
jgi:amidase